MDGAPQADYMRLVSPKKKPTRPGVVRLRPVHYAAGRGTVSAVGNSRVLEMNETGVEELRCLGGNDERWGSLQR